MRATKKGSKATRDRKNDLYARGVPSATTIKEIKHLAAVKRTTVGDIIHREHAVVRDLRTLLSTSAEAEPFDRAAIEDSLTKHGLAAETV
jgi:hypothetical protein